MIINSLLDNDLYKFTMQQLVLHQYPSTWTKYKFKCRNYELLQRVISPNFVYDLNREINHLCSLRFSKEELQYLSKITFLKVDYIDYLSLLKLNKDYIKISYNEEDNDLQIIIEGPWLATILFEVPLLAIISELYMKSVNILNKNFITFGKERLNEKIKLIKESDVKIKFADFGTRRRYSQSFQRYVLITLKDCLPKNIFIGTSNVWLSKIYDLKPIGTFAHEFIMAHQQLGVRLVDSQKAALESWVKEYRGNLGIALSDCINMDVFLGDFDLYFCKLFDGCRQDSGDPYEWCEKLINHYGFMKINPKTKFAIFSDSLTFEKAIDLAKTFGDRINVSFGIGTSLTNDRGIVPLNMVIKMIECNGKPVAKISDSPGKGMCEDEEYLSYLKKVFKVK